MAERNEFGCALGRLDPGQSGGAQHVALRRIPACDERRRLGGHPDHRSGHGTPLADGLAAYVDHPRAPVLVYVREAVYAGTAVRCAAAMRSRTACSSPAPSSSTGSGSPLTIDSKNTLRS